MIVAVASGPISSNPVSGQSPVYFYSTRSRTYPVHEGAAVITSSRNSRLNPVIAFHQNFHRHRDHGPAHGSKDVGRKVSAVHGRLCQLTFQSD